MYIVTILRTINEKGQMLRILLLRILKEPMAQLRRRKSQMAPPPFNYNQSSKKSCAPIYA